MLCFACQIKNVPIFTLKGACSKTKVDWNYYINLNDSGELDFYDGYKLTNLEYRDGKWLFLMKDVTSSNFKYELFVQNVPNYPLGRREWIVKDPNCGIAEGRRNMTISICEFRREFTCHSGHCISIDKRCDERQDCHDDSDEIDCTLVYIPEQYQKVCLLQ